MRDYYLFADVQEGVQEHPGGRSEPERTVPLYDHPVFVRRDLAARPGVKFSLTVDGVRSCIFATLSERDVNALKAAGAIELPFEDHRQLVADSTRQEVEMAGNLYPLPDPIPPRFTWGDWLDPLIELDLALLEERQARDRVVRAADPHDESDAIRASRPDLEFDDQDVNRALIETGQPEKVRPPRSSAQRARDTRKKKRQEKKGRRGPR